MFWNILEGGVGRADPLAETLIAQQADVIALAEADDPSVVERLSRRLAFEAVRFEGKDGKAMALLSRRPPLSALNHVHTHGAPSGLVEVRFEGLTLLMLHLAAGAGDDAERVRLGEIEVVLGRAKAAVGPVLLIGDFNSVSPTQRLDPSRASPKLVRVYEENGSRLPRDVIERILAAGFVDTWADSHPGLAAEAATFETSHPAFRVDFCFARDCVIESAWIETDDLAKFASDHFPIGVKLAPITSAG